MGINESKKLEHPFESLFKLKFLGLGLWTSLNADGLAQKSRIQRRFFRFQRRYMDLYIQAWGIQEIESNLFRDFIVLRIQQSIIFSCHSA